MTHQQTYKGSSFDVGWMRGNEHGKPDATIKYDF